MNQQENTVLLIYRMIGGQRIPYHLELDATMTVVVDRPNIEIPQTQVVSMHQEKIVREIASDSTSDVNQLQQSIIARSEQTLSTARGKMQQIQNEQAAIVEELIKQAALEGHAVRTSNPKLREKFPDLALIDDEDLAAVVKNNVTTDAQSEVKAEAAEDLTSQSKQESRVVKASEDDLIKKYPSLTPVQRAELAESMQGEIEMREMPDGRVHRVYKPTPTDILMGTWVTDIVEENPIPGTDELRAEYFNEVAELKARHEKNGTVCPSCDVGAVMRKWRVKLKNLGFIE